MPSEYFISEMTPKTVFFRYVSVHPDPKTFLYQIFFHVHQNLKEVLFYLWNLHVEMEIAFQALGNVMEIITAVT